MTELFDSENSNPNESTIDSNDLKNLFNNTNLSAKELAMVIQIFYLCEMRSEAHKQLTQLSEDEIKNDGYQYNHLKRYIKNTTLDIDQLCNHLNVFIYHNTKDIAFG
ncbi:unnamed protein product [Rotaria socialis]|uniref:Uncharacterized protein n=1 Tax=Rotaria socialis TaxID=392032 RepID=A0A817S6H9_9BILA|nr:unnamed protein product [Rotaria socialis]CAF4513756.1 unnamed protein product [Rotaria socialis]